MKLEFSAIAATKKSAKKSAKGVFAAITVDDTLKLAGKAAEFNKASGGLVQAAIDASRFKGKVGESLNVPLPAGHGVSGLILLGAGDAKKLTTLTCEHIGGAAVATANRMGATELEFYADGLFFKKAGKGEAAAYVALGANLRAYRFDKYRTTEKADDKPTVQKFTVVTSDVKSASSAYLPLAALLEGTLITRNAVSEPANIIYPESLADICRSLAKDGVKVTVMGEKEMEKLGMGALLGVGQGSRRESQCVIMQWNGGKKGDKPIAFVGKGVCFDTGGISIKPAGGMEEMKWDMGGAGTVIGLMKTLAGRKAKVNVIGAVGLVENMPDGNAQRPGDVVTSMSGQTIEVINTDAEGRLVLADVLYYTNTKFKPKFIVDLATLTGAIIIALGSSRAGLFSNDDKLSQQLFDVGQDVGEEVWRLPLGDVYDKQINSDIADMRNVGEGREAGSITAAQFLQRFIGDTPWAHLDIAGVAWSKRDTHTIPKGATAFGVKLLNALVEKHYEK